MCTSPQKDKTNPGGASHFHTERIDANVGMHRPGGYIEKCTLLLTSTLAEAVTTATVMTARFISQPPRALCCDALGQKSYRNNPIASEAGQLEADVI